MGWKLRTGGALAGAAVLGIGAWVTGLRAQEKLRVPYTLRREIRQMNAQGGVDTSFRTTITEAVRADGSVSRYIDVQLENEPRQAGTRETFDNRTGTFVHVDYEAKILQKKSLTEQARRLWRIVAARCEDVQRRPCRPGPVLLGYPTMITELEIAGSGARSVFYVAEALDWAKLRVENYSVPEGKLRSMEEVTEVIRGEPDPAWFAEPNGFALMKDSVEFLDRSMEARGIPPWTMREARERLKARGQ